MLAKNDCVFGPAQDTQCLKTKQKENVRVSIDQLKGPPDQMV